MLHTMLRVGDLKKTIAFYTEFLGMKLLRTADFPEDKFTLAFLGYGSERAHTCIELTYNYGVTEYEAPSGKAYGHVAIGVEDVTAMVAKMRAGGVEVTYEDDTGFMAFVKDPNGFEIELLHQERMLKDAEEQYAAAAGKSTTAEGAQ